MKKMKKKRKMKKKKDKKKMMMKLPDASPIEPLVPHGGS
jgi:hypothetical protein